MKRLKLFVFFVFSFSFFVHCPAQIISTIAGNGIGGFSGDGGPATLAEFGAPEVKVDKFGNIYIADYVNDRIRKVNTLGIISTFAGNAAIGFSGDGGPASAAELEASLGVGVDDSGNVYIAGGHIRKVNTLGIISTFAGNGFGGYNGDGGPATAAELGSPRDVAADNSGNIYIADPSDNVIREVNTSGIISTFAGAGGGHSGDGGPATSAELNKPAAVAVDNSGNVFIADYDNYCIRKVNTNGIISTIAGNGIIGYTGDGGPATAAELGFTTGVTTDDSGNVFIADNTTSNRIRKVNTLGIISTFAGNGFNSPGHGGYGGDGGPATAAELSGPWGLGSDTSGNIYIADEGNVRIRKIWRVLDVSTILTSNINCYGSNNGSATALASEGTNPYTYSWSPMGVSSSTATGLSAGTYTVFVTDSNNIKGSATITITQPIAINITADSLADYGSCNGSAWVVVNGGTTPYSYFWSGGLTTDTIQNQCLGTYCATIIDAHGCIDSICTTIESATGISNVSNSQSITIYPDPSNGKFIIQSSGNSHQSSVVEIYNVLGEQVKSEELRAKSTEIDLSLQPDGIYLYRVLSESGNLIGEGKVVIER